jgi:hypothetical protein
MILHHLKAKTSGNRSWCITMYTLYISIPTKLIQNPWATPKQLPKSITCNSSFWPLFGDLGWNVQYSWDVNDWASKRRSWDKVGMPACRVMMSWLDMTRVCLQVGKPTKNRHLPHRNWPIQDARAWCLHYLSENCSDYAETVVWGHR